MSIFSKIGLMVAYSATVVFVISCSVMLPSDMGMRGTVCGGSNVSFSFVSSAAANPFTGGGHKKASEQDPVASQVYQEREAAKTDPVISSVTDGNPAHGQEAAAPLSPSATDGSISSGTELASGAPHAGVFALAYTHFLRKLTVAQKELRQRLTVLGSDIAEHPGGSSFWLFVGLSFVYGVIHALGPGHGKSVVFAYFLGKQGSMVRGFVMGHVLTFVHVLSAVTLVFMLRWLLGATGTQGFDEAGSILQRVSYGLVATIGLLMLCHAVYELVSGKLSAKVCCTAVPQASYKGIVTVSALAGLIPCPGAALVLAFALSLNIPVAGLVAVLALALGMGLTTSCFGMLSIVSRRALVYVAGNGPRKLAAAYSVLSIAGALAITLFGVMMFVSATC